MELHVYVTILMLGTVLSSVQGQIADIVGDIQPEVQNVGDTGRLNCTISNKGTSVVVWQRAASISGSEGQVISRDTTIVTSNPTINDRPKYEIVVPSSGVNQTFTLVVNYLTEDDDGTYKCYVHIPDPDYTQWPERNGILTVIGSSPQMIQDVHSQTEKVGTTATLECIVLFKRPSSVIEWRRYISGDVISEDDRIIIPNPGVDAAGNKKYEVKVVPNATGRRIVVTLVIRDLELMDTGFYNCTVRTEGVTMPEWPESSGYLMVTVPPSINPSETVTSIVARRGETVTLSCVADGIPSPEFSWQREDGGILPSGNTIHQDSQLVLHDISVQLRGIYLCIAENYVPPAAELRTRLLVYFAPLSRAINEQVGQTPNTNSTAKLACILSGYTTPVITWYRKIDGVKQSIRASNKYRFTAEPSDGVLDGPTVHTLTIVNIENSDYGEYVCVGTNIEGTSPDREIVLYETAVPTVQTTTAHPDGGRTDINNCKEANCPSTDAHRVTWSVLVLFAPVCLYLAT